MKLRIRSRLLKGLLNDLFHELLSTESSIPRPETLHAELLSGKVRLRQGNGSWARVSTKRFRRQKAPKTWHLFVDEACICAHSVWGVVLGGLAERGSAKMS